MAEHRESMTVRTDSGRGICVACGQDWPCRTVLHQRIRLLESLLHRTMPQGAPPESYLFGISAADVLRRECLAALGENRWIGG